MIRWWAMSSAQQGLVAEQDRGVAEQRLGDAQALLLAARKAPDRRVGEGASRPLR